MRTVGRAASTRGGGYAGGYAGRLGGGLRGAFGGGLRGVASRRPHAGERPRRPQPRSRGRTAAPVSSIWPFALFRVFVNLPTPTALHSVPVEIRPTTTGVTRGPLRSPNRLTVETSRSQYPHKLFALSTITSFTSNFLQPCACQSCPTGSEGKSNPWSRQFPRRAAWLPTVGGIPRCIRGCPPGPARTAPGRRPCRCCRRRGWSEPSPPGCRSRLH